MDLGIAGLGDALQIGSGGSGSVYRAIEEDLNRFVAVKMLHLAHDGATLAAFHSERRMMANLPGHPGVAPIYSSGLTGNGAPYYVMPYYQAGSLGDRIRATGPLPWRDAVELMIGAARAVDHVHGYDVLHCDIKPDNIMIDASGQPVVVDFGISQLLDGDIGVSRAVELTPAYAAPEAFDGRRRDRRYDIYGLGATLFALIAGQPPFVSADGFVGLAARIAGEAPPDLRGLAPDPVCAVMERALSKHPDARQQSAAELSGELEGALAAVAAAAAGPSERTTVHADQFVGSGGSGFAGSGFVGSGSGPGSGGSGFVGSGLGGSAQGTVRSPSRGGLVAVAGAVVAGLIVLVGAFVILSGGDDGPPDDAGGEVAASGSTLDTTTTTETSTSTTDAGVEARSGEIPFEDMERGDCVDVPFDGGVFFTVELLDCNEDHNAEVLGIVQHPDAGGPYPGQAALFQYGGSNCETLFESYVGASSFQTELFSSPLAPIFDKWENEQVYSIICIAARTDLGPLRASVAGRATEPDVALDFGDELPVGRLTLGACFNGSASNGLALDRQTGLSSQRIELASCNELHNGQAVGGALLSGGSDRVFDEAALVAEAVPLCQQQFSVFAGFASQEGVFAIIPDFQEWGAGNRFVVCLALWAAPVTDFFGAAAG